MSRLHKKMRFSFIPKYYIAFILLILFGIYKNGIYPFFNGYGSFGNLCLVCLFPIISLGVGVAFDFHFHNKEIFDNKFIATLFILLVPYKTNIFLYLLVLVLLLLLFNLGRIKKINNSLNIIVIAKLILMLLLVFMKTYSYQNVIESKGLFEYTFLDRFLGFNIGSMYSSSIIIILGAFIMLCFDEFYKKEIPSYSYGIYLISLLIYTFMKQDMGFFLNHMLSSNILFALIFVANLSLFSPYTKKGKALYGISIGLFILPFSLLINFYEGVFLAILLVNLLYVSINVILKKQNLQLK